MIAFASRTGNVRFIVSRLGLPNIEIHEELQLQSPFLLFTYTDGLGDVPAIIQVFMQKNASNCRGVIASGNSNFGHGYFCLAADKISKEYGVPIVQKIELRGFQKNYDAIIDFYQSVFKEVKQVEKIYTTK